MPATARESSPPPSGDGFLVVASWVDERGYAFADRHWYDAFGPAIAAYHRERGSPRGEEHKVDLVEYSNGKRRLVEVSGE